MSLRMLTKPDQVHTWIAARRGVPARRRGTDADLRIQFDNEEGEYERITVDEMIETMKFKHLVLLVDQEAGKTFHRFVERG
jgi:hypothetical protein